MMRCRHYAGKPQQAQAVRAGHGAYLPGQRGRVVRGRMCANCGSTPTHSLGHHRSGTTRCSCSFAAMQTSLAILGECRACYCSFLAEHVIAAGRQVCAGLSLAAGSRRSAGECVCVDAVLRGLYPCHIQSDRPLADTRQSAAASHHVNQVRIAARADT